MNKKQLIKYIGKSCRRWRLSMGYDVKQICDETGYCPATISLFEQGNNNNALLFMWYIAHGFNTDIDFIFGDAGTTTKCSACDLFIVLSEG